MPTLNQTGTAQIGGLTEKITRTGSVRIEGLEELSKKLELVKQIYSMKEVKKMLRPAAKEMLKAIRAEVPVRPDRGRYKGWKNPATGVKKRKGDTRTYYPGNLKMGVKIVTYRKSPSLWVTPKLLKGSAAKEVTALGSGRGRKVDPFYAHMIEFGTKKIAANPFMRRGFSKGKGPAAKALEKALTEALRKARPQLTKGVRTMGSTMRAAA